MTATTLHPSRVGDVERITQRNVVLLLCDLLGYEQLGWLDKTDNQNIIEHRVKHFLLHYQGMDQRPDGEQLADQAIRALTRAANDASLSAYDRNLATYKLLRYGVEVKPDASSLTQTLHLIDWDHPERNSFAVAEEVTVHSRHAHGRTKRPDLVLYVNGIALAIIELKRASVSVSEGIRQSLDNQLPEFIGHFFSTIQLVIAGNETEGLRYGTTKTPETHFLTWKEDTHAEVDNPLHRALLQLCDKRRLLELLHDFVVFDSGIKKLCRHNQYFGVKAAQPFAQRREGGIIWHTQGSGKSLTMVWLARWLREHITNARILIVTDRTELDEQIEKVFLGVNEQLQRADSGADLARRLASPDDALLCSLIHKFGARADDPAAHRAFAVALAAALQHSALPTRDLFVFVDECHRTQSGELHAAMKAALPEATFFGFTGTPLLKADKARSHEVFGQFIHVYKFDQAVRDAVVLDLRYEARDIEQELRSPDKVDRWFDSKTRGLTPLAVAQLKQRWGRLQHIFSSRERLARIVDDIDLDMNTRDRLISGRGNAMLVAGSIYEAFRFYKMFNEEGSTLKGRCAVVSSYAPDSALKGESTGEGQTEAQLKHDVYRQMLADWFGLPPEQAFSRAGEFEQQVKRRFIEQPGQLKLLIVVDKLLTGFDAPSATVLYIDKPMRDHGLFQAICRVNRLDGEDKEFGYIVDYRDLFQKLEGAFEDYTSGALDGFAREDVAGLLEDRLVKGRERLELTLEQLRALCEPVEPPRDRMAHLRYFSARDHGDAGQLAQTEPLRLALYKMTAALVRAYANVAHDLPELGYSEAQSRALRDEVRRYEALREEVKQHSGDAIDLKAYEPAMRHLLDAYIRADDSEVVSTLKDRTLVELLAERGAEAADALAPGLRGDEEAMAETIDNNVRRYILDKNPLNPKLYEEMSTLLEALIARRRAHALAYKDYLEQVVALAHRMAPAADADRYPLTLGTPALRAVWQNLPDHLDGAARLALAEAIGEAMRQSAEEGWVHHKLRRQMVVHAVTDVLSAAGLPEPPPLDLLAQHLVQILAEHDVQR
jgi:type I restriction enzyme, R subunit